jgi:predicted aspartyl protease
VTLFNRRKLAFGFAVLLSAGVAHAACTSFRAASLPMQLFDGKLLIPVTINGTPQHLAIDTGSSATLISSAVAADLNILRDFDRVAVARGVGGVNSAVDIGKVDSLDIGQLHFVKRNLLIVDLPMRGPDGQAVAGFLGADIMGRYDVELDLPGKRLTLWQVEGCPDFQPPWQVAGDPVAIDLDDQRHILVPFRVNGALLTGLLDTGAPMLVLTPRAADRAGAADDAESGDVPVNGTGVNNREWDGRIHRFKRVDFAGDRLENVVTEIINGTSLHQYETLLSGSDGLVGLSVLRGRHLWISYQNKTIFVEAKRGVGAD